MAQRSKVVTRFAPSPTGYLHIGNARTALFNWLYARHCGGVFKLRIEDTDRKRSTDDAIQAILDGLSWLGIDWDGDPIFQFTRADRHREIVEGLLSEGNAYRCYVTPEELANMRDKARAEGKNQVYDRRWRDRDPSDAPSGVDPVIRLKAPLEGETVIEDRVQGDVRFKNADLDDMVLLRSDGTPTYMLSVVVDDHDMGITHVIRGDDHLNNAARQAQIFTALNWELPTYAHVPLIHGPDGAKLSKRHGSLGVDAYREMGLLPETMRNYLLRLGWSHGDDEIIDTVQATEWFDLGGLNKSAARLDFQKMESLNGHYFTHADDDRLTAMTVAEVEHAGGVIDEVQSARIQTLMPELKERAKTIKDLAASIAFLISKRPLEIDAKMVKSLQKDGAKDLLKIVGDRLAALENWDADALDQLLKDVAAEQEVGFGRVAQPLRAAITGTPNAPSIAGVLIALGKEEVLARIRDQLSEAT